MKIIYIHQLFRTPEEGGGIRSYYLAKTLVDAGHQVEMITTHNSKSGLEVIDGINVHYLHIPYYNSFGFLKRLWAYGQFVLKARKKAKEIGHADLAYVMTTPLTTGWIAIWVKKNLGIPYFFEVGDLWPDVPIEMGVIKNSWLKNWLLKKEKLFYDKADKVIAMSPPQVENIQSKTSTPVELIPNMADTSFYEVNYREINVSVNDPLRILYCGAHGQANQLEFLIAAARECRELPILFTLMGSGSEKPRIQKLASDLKNVRFLDHGSKEEVKSQLKAHDAVYLSFQNLPILHTGCPNKFFDALASGKMVFSNIGSWTAHLIQQERIGFAYSGDQPEVFKREVQRFFDLANIRSAQEGAFKLSAEYSRSNLSSQFLASIENR